MNDTISIIRLAEFAAMLLMFFLAIFISLVAHYREPIIDARRVQWGMVGIAFVVAIDRLMLLWGIASAQSILAFGGVTISLIILATHWKVIWHFFKRDKQ